MLSFSSLSSINDNNQHNQSTITAVRQPTIATTTAAAAIATSHQPPVADQPASQPVASCTCLQRRQQQQRQLPQLSSSCQPANQPTSRPTSRPADRPADQPTVAHVRSRIIDMKFKLGIVQRSQTRIVCERCRYLGAGEKKGGGSRPRTQRVGSLRLWCDLQASRTIDFKLVFA